MKLNEKMLARPKRKTVLVRGLLGTIAIGISIIGVSGCGKSETASNNHSTKKIDAVGSAPQFADVLSQVGGKYVKVSFVMGNPNVAPHSFQTSPKVAQMVTSAQIVVQNGLGFDAFMNKMESAHPNSGQKVVELQKLFGLPNTAPNPHLFYKLKAPSLLANAIANDLSSLEPAHSSYFHANAKAFNASLKIWENDIAKLKKTYGGTAVMSITPVGDYLLQTAGLDNLTPWRFQADIMNGVSPTPQDVALMRNLILKHKVKVIVHNHNVSTPTTNAILQLAEKNHIPNVGLYGTMPPGGYTYQTWMEAETNDIYKAIAHGTSSPSL